jgi:hypothetical protein
MKTKNKNHSTQQKKSRKSLGVCVRNCRPRLVYTAKSNIKCVPSEMKLKQELSELD